MMLMGTNRTTLLVAVISILSCTVCPAANTANSADRSSPISMAFVDVNLVSMNCEEVIEHQTNLIERDRIVAIGPTAAVRVPPGARRIADTTRHDAFQRVDLERLTPFEDEMRRAGIWDVSDNDRGPIRRPRL
jgi:hypothetical protein